MTGKTVAFVGLGTMGYPVAGHLQQAGHHVRVYNRSPEKAERWVQEFGGERTDSPAEAAQDAEIVLACVGNDQDLREVVTGARGIRETLAEGAVLVDHTTTSAEVARELASVLAEKGAHFVDAPVSGGEQGARAGKLTIMCGGDASVFQRVEPVLGIYGANVTRMGETGAGQLTKMVNQICVTGVIEGLAEGMAFAENAGLDVAAVIELLQHGAAGSWQMSNRYRTMLNDEYDHGFAVDWMRKDLDLCLHEARENGSELPLVEQVNRFYEEIREMGGGRWDTSSLLRRLQHRRRRNMH